MTGTEKSTPQGELVISETRIEAAAFLHPTQGHKPSPDYIQYLSTRTRIVTIIRSDGRQDPQLVGELADTLIENDPEFPTGILSVVKNIAKFGKTLRERKDRRELYCRVTRSLLEKLFQPDLEFKMTVQDILDTFEANGLDRDKVTQPQIGKVYSLVIERLLVGEIRDKALGEDLASYLTMKIREIRSSRQDWNLNWR